MPSRPLVILLAAGALAVPAAVAPAQSQAPGGSVPADTGASFFSAAIAKDAKTTAAIKKGLASGADFVDPATQYGDLTGDGKPDAAVRVDTASVQGATAVFVFAAEGSKAGQLRIVYRNQGLNRVTAKIARGLMTLSSPIWAPGDEPCCPHRLRQADYAWSAKGQTMVRRGAARTVSH